jgi:hypothetical protein
MASADSKKLSTDSLIECTSNSGWSLRKSVKLSRTNASSSTILKWIWDIFGIDFGTAKFPALLPQD